MERIITEERIRLFGTHLCETEKSPVTVKKYLRDVRAFAVFLSGRSVERTLVQEYKEKLILTHCAVGANSMLAAVNALLSCFGWTDCRVRSFRVQRQLFRSEERELTRAEYERLCRAAEQRRDERLGLVLQTLCGAGIRVSELQYITVEAVQTGEVNVSCKAKIRRVFLVSALRKKLARFAAKRGICSGPIFVTKTGSPVDRTWVWRAMKSLCADARVLPEKVFPHNLREPPHFVRTAQNAPLCRNMKF